MEELLRERGGEREKRVKGRIMDVCKNPLVYAGVKHHNTHKCVSSCEGGGVSAGYLAVHISSHAWAFFDDGFLDGGRGEGKVGSIEVEGRGERWVGRGGCGKGRGGIHRSN